jgi:hypothetical protein
MEAQKVREPTELEAAIAALPEGTIKYETKFVPYSKVSTERKAGWGGVGRGNQPRLFLSWVVTINGESFEYSAGIGHISNPELAKAALKLGWTIYEKDAITAWVEGRWLPITNSVLGAQPFDKLPANSPRRQAPPALADVLSSLLLDSSALGAKFEEWADNFGYDKDSREAERIYNASRDNSYRLFRALGGALVDKLIGLEH